jgi:non-specific serine/threonine protein kinase
MRRFGRFELKALLSKTARSMMWLAFDPRASQDMLLCMPRTAPADPQALADWIRRAGVGARIQHPNLAHAVEVSQVERWPFIAYDRALGETLEERLARDRVVLPMEWSGWICQALDGLAFAHESGHAHRDIQLSSLLIDGAGHVRLLGLEVAQEPALAGEDFNTATRRVVREAAEEDVLRMGLLLHRGLTARPVLEQNDLQQVIQLMQPKGQELVRLGWETPHPIAEPLRAIANRSTDRQARQRYHSARSFLRALEGWRSAANDQGGAIALLLDRVQRYGHLPISSTRLQRAVQSSGLENQHASALSTLVLQDVALSLELLRRVNNALKQEGLESGGGAVLNMQRAIAMLGLNGVQAAARSLKIWPGTLNEQQAGWMQTLMKRVHRAGQIAQALRPAGYDAEVVYLITTLQNLGRLLLQYHFPEDAQQIRQLMQPPEPTVDAPHPAGMSEQAAAYAVLGCDLESIGAAVARQWSLGEELLHMIRRQGSDAPVRSAGTDAELLRLSCSLANELVEALLLPEERRKAGVELVTRRYARVLGIGLREVYLALQPPSAAPTAAPTAGASTSEAEAGRPAEPADASAATVAPAPAPAVPIPSRLRARAAGDGSVPERGN